MAILITWITGSTSITPAKVLIPKDHTKGKGPWKLIGFVECDSRSEAMNIENKLKNMKNPSRAYHWLKRNGTLS